MKRSINKDDGILNLVQRLDMTVDLPETRIITFISARPGEGTSTIARDYAQALTDAVEQQILLIDAGKLDTEYFTANDADPNITIADTIGAGKPLSDALYPIGQHLHLGRWAGQGRSRGTANKLLGDDAFWKKLHKTYGTVVIDAPSLKESPDGIGLAAHADATVLVIEAEATRQPVIEHLRSTLDAAGAKIIGVVLNKRRLYIPDKVYRNM